MQTAAQANHLESRRLLRALRAFRRGDFSVRLPEDMAGVDGEIARSFNEVVELNQFMTREFERLSTVVGKEGKIGQRGKVVGAQGGWEASVDSVNRLIGDLVQPTTEVARVIGAVAKGDLSQTMVLEIDGSPLRGEFLRIGKTVNTMVGQLGSFASEVTRVAREVGTEGKLGGQARVKGVAGTWKDLTDNVNAMATNLTGQVRNIAEVTTAVAKGDLSKKITVDVKGEILELKDTINTMVDQLNSFASEVTRVAREVGTEGKLGGQARVEGVAGTWKDLTDNVNLMATNLTNQVRGIADVVTAVARGDLKRKLAVDAKGEIAALANTINGMIETLATFADQVTNVAREVGIEGKLGGQAKVPGAAGLWRDLTDNVNQLAANLTTQVRAIAEVATAVTKGDLTRSITVEASGEVAALSDNINEMIRNLKDTTQKNMEQDWLKTNLTRFTRMLQGERDLMTVSNLILSELAPLVDAQYGIFYVGNRENDETVLDLVASYASEPAENLTSRFRLREGLIGQCAQDKRRMLLTNVPGDYLHIGSGLGRSAPVTIIVLPVLFEGEIKAVIELASFGQFSDTHQSFLDQLMESIGIVLNTIAATMRTEGLLTQSQLLTGELQSQQEELKKTNDRLEMQARSLRKSEEMLKSQREELRRTNEELQEKAQLLSNEKKQVETKNLEVELAKSALEEKAEQLALTSKYKSEFLANMSHELRTPLNSLLILSKLLGENTDGNLTEKQTEFARTINAAGSDLLSLINDILDLSKIESGTVTLDVSDMPFQSLRHHMERTFGQVADDKELDFSIEFSDALPRSIKTDEKRLQQVVMNLLSNAFKFTKQGSVRLQVKPVTEGWSGIHPALKNAKRALSIAVSDTGIGIPEDKQRIIFEAFQQADGTTSRKYGGTGLGLSISREIARLLGGEIHVASTPSAGSTFTLYLPFDSAPATLGFTADAVLPAQSYIGGTEDAGLALFPSTEIKDDREHIRLGDPVALIVEQDVKLAGVLLDLARQHGFKGAVSTTGAGTLSLAKKFRPDAMILEIGLSDMDGWVLLDLLKRDSQTRHVPVHVISAEAYRWRALNMGAFDFTARPAGKPVDKDALVAAFDELKRFTERWVKKLLLVDDDEVQRRSIVSLISDEDVQIETATSPDKALKTLTEQEFDCLVVNLATPEAGGVELIGRVRSSDRLAAMPIVVYATEHEAGTDEQLRKLAETAVLRCAKSTGELFDDTALFLHRIVLNLADEKRRLLQQTRLRDPILRGRKVLIIDDDIRNIFSLISVFERHAMEVLYAENGRDGIALLEDTPDIDVALIDIMMPDMDGFQTMRQIRQREDLKTMPLIAVTAKAMKGDRQKCVAAGASDYVAKPVDIDLLLSLIRVRLQRQEETPALAAGAAPPPSRTVEAGD